MQIFFCGAHKIFKALNGFLENPASASICPNFIFSTASQEKRALESCNNSIIGCSQLNCLNVHLLTGTAINKAFN